MIFKRSSQALSRDHSSSDSSDNLYTFTVTSSLMTLFCSLPCARLSSVSPQVLAGGLSANRGGRDLRQSAVPRADVSAVHGQICGVRQDERRQRGSPALLLHDGRQNRQNPRAARELLRGGAQQGHRGKCLIRVFIFSAWMTHSQSDHRQ